jgi:hypothetical protein
VEGLALGTKNCCPKRKRYMYMYMYMWMDIEMLLVQKYNEDAGVNYVNLSIKFGWF